MHWKPFIPSAGILAEAQAKATTRPSDSPIGTGGHSPEFTQIATGEWHTVALDEDGHIWTWGHNGYGQLGNGESDFYGRNAPAKLDMPVTFTQIEAGSDHSLALDENGCIWTWGRNEGRPDDDDMADSVVPTRMELPVTFTQITAGGRCSAALDSNGHIWTWGHGFFDKSDDSRIVDFPSPVMLDVDAMFTQVAAGLFHSLAVDTDGHIWAWGWNGCGQLGIGGGTDRCPTPKRLDVDAVFTQAAVSSYHSLAVDTDGHVWAWGDNGCGQLGSSDGNRSLVPTMLSVDAVFTQVLADNWCSIAVDSDGHIWAWGVTDRRRGYGFSVDSPVPVIVEAG